MAKFSSAFLQSLTRPAYMEGLFTAGERLGSLPRRREEKKTFEGMMEELSAAQGDAATVGSIYEKYGAQLNRPEMQLEGAAMRREAEQASAMTATQNQIAMKVRQLSNPDITPEQRAVTESEVVSLARSSNDPAILEGAYTDIDNANKASRTALDSAAVEAVSSGVTREEFEAKYGKKNGYRYEAAKATAINRRNTIRDSEKAGRIESYNTRIADLKLQIAREGQKPSDQIDMEKLTNLEAQMIDLAKEASPEDAAEFVGIAQTAYNERVDAEVQAEQAANETLKAANKQRADGIVTVLMMGQDPLKALQDQIDKAEGPAKTFLTEQEQYISDEIEAQLESRNRRLESLETKEINELDLKWLQTPENQNFFVGMDEVEEALADIDKHNNGEKVLMRSEYNRRLNIVTNAISKAKDEKRRYERSETVAEEKAVEGIDAFLKVTDKSSRFYDPSKVGATPAIFGIRLAPGRSLYDVVSDLRKEGGEEYNRLVGKLTASYMQNPNEPFTQMVTRAIEEMDIATPGQEFFEVRQERLTETTNERRELIRGKIRQQNPKAKGKELEALYSDEAAVAEAASAVDQDFIAIQEQELEASREQYRKMQTLRRTSAVRGSR